MRIPSINHVRKFTPAHNAVNLTFGQFSPLSKNLPFRTCVFCNRASAIRPATAAVRAEMEAGRAGPAEAIAAPLSAPAAAAIRAAMAIWAAAAINLHDRHDRRFRGNDRHGRSGGRRQSGGKYEREARSQGHLNLLLFHPDWRRCTFTLASTSGHIPAAQLQYRICRAPSQGLAGLSSIGGDNVRAIKTLDLPWMWILL